MIWIQSTTTERNDQFVRSTCLRHGTAEIELMLVMPLLIVLLFLLLNTMRLHDARQRVRANAVAGAWHDMAESTGIPGGVGQYLPPRFWEITTVSLRLQNPHPQMPGIGRLPNRVYVAREQETLDFYIGNQPAFAYGTFQEKSALIGPSWTYLSATGLPNLSVRPVRSWYTQLGRYATADLQQDLRIAGD